MGIYIAELARTVDSHNFLSISLNMCFGVSKEASQRDMFWLRNKIIKKDWWGYT